MGTLTEISLFTGGGGGVWGSILLGHRPVCYVEIDPYCQKIIRQRIEDGIFPDAPIWDDVRTFDGRPWRGKVDIVTGGFPCQPFSVAGKRRGENDERNLWPETIRVIREVRPRFAFLENVSGLLTSGYFGTILRDIHESGYDARWMVLGADDVGAPHRRKRLWIYLADSNNSSASRQREHGRQRLPKPETNESSQGRESMADTDSPGRRERWGTEPVEPELNSPQPGGQVGWWLIDPADLPDTEGDGLSGIEINSVQGECSLRSLDPKGSEDRSITSGWPTQSFVGRVAHGVAHRVNRLKALGNGQVPAVVREAWNILTGE